jgi:hypothetical protein
MSYCITYEIQATSHTINQLVSPDEMSHDWLIYLTPNNADANVISWYQKLNYLESGLATLNGDPEFYGWVSDRHNEIDSIINMISNYLEMIS